MTVPELLSELLIIPFRSYDEGPDACQKMMCHKGTYVLHAEFSAEQHYEAVKLARELTHKATVVLTANGTHYRVWVETDPHPALAA
ncbi:MAG: hypothetical protein ACFB0C_22615 [Leptolyngbyaceae cyanobacterium]